MGDAGMAAWLADEARSHLDDFGHFGLYEFLWTLNGADFDVSPDRARAIATGVVALFVPSSAQLRRVRWPHDIVSPPLPLSVLEDDDSWQVGEEFVALVLTTDPAPN